MPLPRMPSCSSSSNSEDDEYQTVASPLSACQLLKVAINKRRALASRKDRRLHLELLHTGMIQSLCKHLGEGRASRRRRGKKRTSSQSQDNVFESSPQPPVQALTDQEPCSKRTRVSEDDPFELDNLFMDVFGRVPSVQSRSASTVPRQLHAVAIVA